MRSAALVLVMAALAACSSVQHGVGRNVAQGIDYSVTAPWPDSRVHVLQIDLRTPGLRLQLSPPEARGRAVTEMPATAAAAVSINASFFDRRFVPRGITVSDGQAWAEVLAADASPALGCDPTLRCTIRLQYTAERDPRWFTAVAGRPWLVRSREPRAEGDDATCTALCAAAHPRTAIGLKHGGKTLVIVLVEGRQPGRSGISLAALAAHMAGSLGVENAINLDGGGSSTLWLRGQPVMGRPANEPAEWALANTLHVFSQPAGPLLPPGADP